MSYDDSRFEAQGQLVLQNCNSAQMQIPGQSIMLTNVDLHTVLVYHDKVRGDPRNLAGDQELSFEKRDLFTSDT